MKHSKPPLEGFKLPVYVALTQPPLFAGVPRELGILTVVTTLVFTLGLHLWLIGLGFGLGLFGVSVALTRHDAHWIAVFRRHLKQPTFLDW